MGRPVYTARRGRYVATVTANGDGWMTLLTRDGDCLHGYPSRHYKTEHGARTGADLLVEKASAE